MSEQIDLQSIESNEAQLSAHAALCQIFPGDESIEGCDPDYATGLLRKLLWADQSNAETLAIKGLISTDRARAMRHGVYAAHYLFLSNEDLLPSLIHDGLEPPDIERLAADTIARLSSTPDRRFGILRMTPAAKVKAHYDKCLDGRISEGEREVQSAAWERDGSPTIKLEAVPAYWTSVRAEQTDQRLVQIVNGNTLVSNEFHKGAMTLDQRQIALLTLLTKHEGDWATALSLSNDIRFANAPGLVPAWAKKLFGMSLLELDLSMELRYLIEQGIVQEGQVKRGDNFQPRLEWRINPSIIFTELRPVMPNLLESERRHAWNGPGDQQTQGLDLITNRRNRKIPEKIFQIVAPDTILTPDGRLMFLNRSEVDRLNDLGEQGWFEGEEATQPTDSSDLSQLGPRLAYQGLARLSVGGGIESLRLDTERSRILDMRRRRDEEVSPFGPVRSPEGTKRHVRELLETQGFALTNVMELGLPPGTTEYIKRNFFDKEGGLQVYDDDIPSDRERARELIDVQWLPPGVFDGPRGAIHVERGGSFYVSRHVDTEVGVRHRSNIPDENRPEYLRFDPLSDKHLSRLIRTQLHLIPEGERERFFTYGANAFRTHTDVVARTHQDEERFAILYCVGLKHAIAPRTYLYPYAGSGRFSEHPVFAHALVPGDIVIFRDADFGHKSEPIVPKSSRILPSRDMLVSTINYAKTHAWQIDQRSWSYPGL